MLLTPSIADFILDILMPIEGIEGVIRGEQTEQRVAEVLRTIPYVSEVTLTEQHTPLIDLVVFFSPDQTIIPLPSVNVQVKSSKRHLSHFKEQKIPVTKSEDAGVKDATMEEDRALWLAEKRLILINGGVYRSKKTKQKRQVTDEEIVTSFTTKLTEIVNFHTQNMSEYLPEGI